MRRKDKTLEKILLFVALSLLLHLGFGIFFYQIHTPRSGAVIPPPTRPEVVFVNPQDFIQQPASPGRPLEIADIAKPKVQKAPKKARFAAQYDSSVDQETVAKRIPKRAKLKAEESEEEGEKALAETPQQSPPLAMKTEEAPAKEATPPEVKPEEKPKEVSLNDLSLKPTDFKDLLPKEKKSTSEKPLAMKSKEPSETFTPGRPGKAGPGDQFVHDFFPNVKIGGKTYLNASAFPDVQYFTQLKRIFRMRFNPEPPLRHHLSGNRVVLGKVTVTMAVTVSRGGQLSELFVVRSSGIPGYDREALETVRESSPFSAPPQKVLDKDGVLRMTWSFITYL